MKLAMLLAVYHEGERIRACIEHHRSFVDAIVCAHDGPCSDSTSRIAAELGAHTLETPERYEYCEPVREWARKKAIMLGCDWAIVADVDEKFNVEYLGNLRRLIASAEEISAIALVTNRITHFLPPETREDLTWDLQLRTFKLAAGHFTDVIHTNVMLHGGNAIYLPPEYYIEHWCFYDADGSKSRRYLRVTEMLLEKYKADVEVTRHLTRALEETKAHMRGQHLEV